MAQPNRGSAGKAIVVPPITKGSGSKPGAAGDKNLVKPVHVTGIKGSGNK